MRAHDIGFIPIEERPTAEDYVRAQGFRNVLRKSELLTDMQKAELFRQALHGDMAGALKAYRILLGRDGD